MPLGNQQTYMYINHLNKGKSVYFKLYNEHMQQLFATMKNIMHKFC